MRGSDFFAQTFFLSLSLARSLFPSLSLSPSHPTPHTHSHTQLWRRRLPAGRRRLRRVSWFRKRREREGREERKRKTPTATGEEKNSFLLTHSFPFCFLSPKIISSTKQRRRWRLRWRWRLRSAGRRRRVSSFFHFRSLFVLRAKSKKKTSPHAKNLKTMISKNHSFSFFPANLTPLFLSSLSFICFFSARKTVTMGEAEATTREEAVAGESRKLLFDFFSFLRCLAVCFLFFPFLVLSFLIPFSFLFQTFFPPINSYGGGGGYGQQQGGGGGYGGR